MVTASPPRSRRPQVGCRPAGISEASWTARRGLFCPWPASGWEAVLPAPQPGTGVPVLLPRRPRASRSSFTFVRDGSVPRRDRDRSLDGEPMRRSRKGRGWTRLEKHIASPRLPADSVRCAKAGSPFLDALKYWGLVGTKKQGKTHFCFVGRNSTPRRAVGNVFI